MDNRLPELERLQPSRIVLRSSEDTIELKQLVHGDAVDYFALVDADRAHLSQYQDVTAQKYPTVESVEESIERGIPGNFRFGIWEDEHMIGLIKLARGIDGSYETGSWISSYQAGNHYAHRAREIALNFAFGPLKAKKVTSKIVVGNEASRKSVERSGYQLVEEKNGEWHYELTKEAFKAQRDEAA